MFKHIFKNLFLYIALLFTLSATAGTPIENLLRQSNDPIVGNAKGKVTIVEFFDYQCSYCVSMSSTLHDIIKANPDVRVVFKEFPIRGDVSEFAARAALAANMQGKYYVFHQALMRNARHLNNESILELAKQVGLDVERLKKDMNGPSVTAQLQNTRRLAEAIGVSVTPTFYIGKTQANDMDALTFQLGALPKTSLQNLINDARK